MVATISTGENASGPAGSRLVFRTVQAPEDREAIYRLMAVAFDDQSASDYVRSLDEHYPAQRPDHTLIVVDPDAPALPELPSGGGGEVGGGVDSGGGGDSCDGGQARVTAAAAPAVPRVVATLRLIPIRWRFGGLDLPVAQLEFVATDPAYQGRGLQRILHEQFDRLAQAEGYLLAGVLGIPGFYSRFGFVYSSPIDGSASFPPAEALRAIEEDPLRDRGRAFVTRPWTTEDFPMAADLWERQAATRDLTLVRSRGIWEYLRAAESVVGRRYVVTEIGGGGEARADSAGPADGADGRIVGLFGIWRDPNRFSAFDVTALERDVALEIHRYVAAEAVADGRTRVMLRIPETGLAHDVALEIGGRAERNYGWQVKVYDRPGLLRHIAPLLEARLAASGFRALTASVVVDLYTSRVTMVWDRGRLAEISESAVRAKPAPARLRLPTEVFAPLLLGYKTIDDLGRERREVLAGPAVEALCRVLFPRLTAWMQP